MTKKQIQLYLWKILNRCLTNEVTLGELLTSLPRPVSVMLRFPFRSMTKSFVWRWAEPDDDLKREIIDVYWETPVLSTKWSYEKEMGNGDLSEDLEITLGGNGLRWGNPIMETGECIIYEDSGSSQRRANNRN